MMKRMLAVVVCLMLFALPAWAEDDRTVKVNGNACVSLQADIATIQIGVDTRSDDVNTAQTENAQLMQQVFDALLGAGIAEDDMYTCNFNVFSGYEFKTDENGNEIRIQYYNVSNVLCVTVRDLTAIGEIVDLAVQAGANEMYGLTFASTRENEAYHQALTRAVEDAKAKAETLCAASGTQLGQLIDIDATNGGYFVGVRNTFTEDKAAGASTVISGGDVEVSATVTLTFEIK